MQILGTVTTRKVTHKIVNDTSIFFQKVSSRSENTESEYVN